MYVKVSAESVEKSRANNFLSYRLTGRICLKEKFDILGQFIRRIWSKGVGGGCTVVTAEAVS